MHIAITGASSGIGEALAREFAAAGDSITLVARREKVLKELASTLKTPTFVAGVDLSKPAGITDWISEAESRLGPIDVLINNAGSQILARTEEVEPAASDAIFQLNLLTPVRLTRVLLPGMLARRKGTIVNISSLAAVSANIGMYHYCATKAGIAAASESLRLELKGTGVHVLTVYPGPVKTALADTAFGNYKGSATKVPTGDVATLAKRVAVAVEKHKARIIYPRFYTIGFYIPSFARIGGNLIKPTFMNER